MRNLQILFVKCNESKFGEISQDVAKIMTSSKLGYKLFAFLHDKLVSEVLANFVKNALDKLGSKKMTAEWMATTTQQGMAEVARLGRQELMETMREIAVTYRGHDVKVKCSSAAEELRLRLTTAVKNRAVGSEGLPALSWEGFSSEKLQD